MRKLTVGAAGPGRTRNVTVLAEEAPCRLFRKLTPDGVGAATADPYRCDYIEVNACPGACMNGGGLLNGEQNSLKRKQLVQALNERHALELAMVDPLALASAMELEFKSSALPLEYVFAPVEHSAEKDLVAVGSTW